MIDSITLTDDENHGEVCEWYGQINAVSQTSGCLSMFLLVSILLCETHHDTPEISIFYIWVLPENHTELRMEVEKSA